ncbi:MAG: hypothetical protein RL885_12495 [Planctomycetota bacterium]
MWMTMCLILAIAQDPAPSDPERDEKVPSPPVSQFAADFIEPADAIALGRIVSVRQLSSRSVFVARFEVERLLKGETEHDLLLMAHTPEAFQVSAQKRILFARQYRENSRFYLALGEFGEADATWKEKLARLEFLIALEEGDEPLLARRQKLLDRLLEEASLAPEWTRSNGVMELEFLAREMPELFTEKERTRLDRMIENEDNRARRRRLEAVRRKLDEPRRDSSKSRGPLRRRSG